MGDGIETDVWLRRIQAIGALVGQIGVPGVVLGIFIWVGVPIVQQFSATLEQISGTLGKQAVLLDKISAQLVDHDRKQDAFRDEELMKNAKQQP